MVLLRLALLDLFGNLQVRHLTFLLGAKTRTLRLWSAFDARAAAVRPTLEASCTGAERERGWASRLG